MLKIGQIGIGHNHSDKFKVLHRYPELFEVVGYAEENEEWVARRGEKPYFKDVPRLSIEEILEKSDAVIVETDVWNLTKTAQMCVDAGKHIHIDKPASGTLEEYKHLLDTAKEKNLVVQLGYMYRYNPAVLKLIEMVQKGELGTISAIDAQMSIRHSDKYRTWLRNFKGGDMYIFGSHLIDLIVYLLGKPKKVLSSVVMSGENGVDGPDLSAAILEYDRAIARVFSSSLEWDGWGNRCFAVDGSLGVARIQPMEEPCVMAYTPKYEGTSYRLQKTQTISFPEQGNDKRYDDMLIAFHDYIVGKKENPFSYEHDYAVQEVIWDAVGGIESLGQDIG